MKTAFVLLSLLLASPAASVAGDFVLLTTGKTAAFKATGDPARDGGLVQIGRDPNLRAVLDPSCPTTTAVQVSSYPQAVARVTVNLDVPLDCAKWRRAGRGFVYADRDGTVRRIRLAPDGLRIAIRGPAFTPMAGPVAYLEANLLVGDTPLRARFHSFARNDATKIATRRTSAPAAAGEAGFWETIVGLDTSEARQQETLRLLERAARADRRDGRSRFLLAMTHLYRFGQMIPSYDVVSDAARAELVAADEWFTSAVPLLWDGERGDSRVPGFAASAKYVLGAVTNDAALRAQGLADLARAVEANAFFNVFDYLTVVQIAPAGSPEFQIAFDAVASYLNDPTTLQCTASQPQICGNEGFAANNLVGSLLLFGDIYAKAGDLPRATQWYSIAAAFAPADYPFKTMTQERAATATARVAAYLDSDPSNDPAVVGLGKENCATCHAR